MAPISEEAAESKCIAQFLLYVSTLPSVTRVLRIKQPAATSLISRPISEYLALNNEGMSVAQYLVHETVLSVHPLPGPVTGQTTRVFFFFFIECPRSFHSECAGLVDIGVMIWLFLICTKLYYRSE